MRYDSLRDKSVRRKESPMFEVISSYIPNPLIASAAAAAAFTAVLYAALPLIGWIIHKFGILEYRLFRSLIGKHLASFLCNRLTFPGVIVHELSHAVMATITGAKVTGISFFDLFRGSLGHVSLVFRGNAFIKSLQKVFSSSAPVLAGCGLSYILFQYMTAMESGWQGYALLGYLLFSIITHASMSAADIRIYKSGLKVAVPLTLLIAFLAVYFTSAAS